MTTALTAVPTEHVLSALRARWPALLALYVYGSVARGDTGPDSDVDLAILLPGKADVLALWEAGNDLAVRLRRDVDLVDLRAASTVMQHQIVTTGVRLWAADAQAGIYETFILSEKTALDEARAGLLADVIRTGSVHGR
jgi:predicted nucleotidyltransferase